MCKHNLELMIMTVIYSNFEDRDTSILKKMWDGLDSDVIEFSFGGERLIDKTGLMKILEKETDTVLFCGHGSNMGCWAPGIGFSIDESVLPHLRAKNIIGIWCHASSFAIMNNLHGFFTSMFISNALEAKFVDIPNSGNVEIYNSEKRFCNRVNELLREKVPLSEWKDTLISQMKNGPHNAVEEYNYDGLFFA